MGTPTILEGASARLHAADFIARTRLRPPVYDIAALSHAISGAPRLRFFRRFAEGEILELKSHIIMQDYTKDSYGTGYTQQIWDYDVLDREGSKVGTVNNLWPKERGEGYSFIGVSTGWFFGREHVVPADGLRIDHERREVSLPLSSDSIKSAPEFAVQEDISDQQRDDIYRHYGATSDRKYSTDTGSNTGAAADRELPIREEKLEVGKREVRDGEVRLRRIVRTEQVNVPVELKREDVVVERVPANEATSREGRISGDKEITIPISHEEAVVEKRTETTGAVRARKTKETHQETISDTVRKEDVDVDRSKSPRDQR